MPTCFIIYDKIVINLEVNMSKVAPKVRRPKFDTEDMPEYYWNGNPVATHFLNSAHMVFPDGEKLFIRYVKKFSDQIQDPQLKERVKGFIGQEMSHSSVHEKIMQMLESRGLPAEEIRSWYAKTAYNDSENFFVNLFGDITGLTVTAGLEHWTSILAEAALENNSEVLSGIHPEMRRLLRWHAAEEIEHKSVAFDVLKTVDDRYFTRALGMIIATFYLGFYMAYGWAAFLTSDKKINWLEIPGHALNALPVAVQATMKFTAGFWRYFLPDFHPDDIENDEMAAQVMQEENQFLYEMKAG